MEDKIYQIFVSSTFKDLEEERQEVLAAIIESGNMPVGMEYFPSTNATPFDYIKKMLEKVDYYILILAGKYGTIESNSGLSYTELEYDYAQQLGIPTMVFLHKDIDQLKMTSNETTPEMREKLNAFRAKVSTTLSKMWLDKKELKSHVLASIPQTIKLSPRVGWIRADKSTAETDDFDYTQVAYHTSTDDIDLWEIEHSGDTFQEKDILWSTIVKQVFPSLQSMLSKYDVLQIVKQKCGDISDNDFEKIFLKLQSLHLIKQEILTYPEGSGNLYFCLTNKGTSALLRLSNETKL